jgi:hypothetical protein
MMKMNTTKQRFLFNLLIAGLWTLTLSGFSLAKSLPTSSQRPLPKALRDVNAYLKNHVRTDVGGEGLWLPQLDDKLTKWMAAEPGFAGKVYYVHATDLPGLFKYRFAKFDFTGNHKILTPRVIKHEWTPAYVRTRYRLVEQNRDSIFEIEETKFINDSEEAFSIVDIVNTSPRKILPHNSVPDLSPMLTVEAIELLEEKEPAHLPLVLSQANAVEGHIQFKPTTYYFTTLQIDKHYLLSGLKYSSAEKKLLSQTFALAPQQHQRFTVRMIFGNSAAECREKLAESQKREILQSRIKDFNDWFADNVPEFHCSDQAIEKMYYYRWYVLKKCSINARRFVANHPYPDRVMYEGVAGRWFTKVIGLPLPLQIMEARWLHDKSYATGQARVALTKPDFFDYLNWTPYAIWQLNLVAPNQQLIKDALPVMRNFVTMEAAKDEDQDGLPTVWGSWITGMEYQPSFHYFTKPRWDHTRGDEFVTDDQLTKDPAVYKKYLSLERVDEATYYYLNHLAVAKGARLTGDAALAIEYERRAATIRRAVKEKMWDRGTEFFYDLYPQTDEKAGEAKMADGFFPFLFGELAEPNQTTVFKHLLNPKEFWTDWPVPSASQDCPAFDAHGRWKVGPQASAENPYNYVCNWNGPTWVFSNALVLDALGSAAQKSFDETLRGAFVELFRRHTMLQYLKQDLSLPCVVEHYDSHTGENIRLLADYFHSSYNDLLIRFLVGVKPREDDLLEIAPLAKAPLTFSIKGIRYRDHRLTVTYNRRVSVNVDGKTIFNQPGTSRILYNPQTGKVVQ